MTDEKDPKCCSGDELVPGPEIGNGSRFFVRHTADHKVLAGVMSPVREGQPLMPGAFNLEPIEGTDRFRVEDLPSMAPPSQKGPAKVNSAAFKNGWDNIFGKKSVIGEA